MAPLVVALTVGLLTPFNDQLERLLTIVAWYVGAATLGALVGIPTFVLLRRLNLVRWWSALATGLCTGAIAFAIVGTTTAVGLRGTIPMALLGGVSALVFWFIYRPEHAV